MLQRNNLLLWWNTNALLKHAINQLAHSLFSNLEIVLFQYWTASKTSNLFPERIGIKMMFTFLGYLTRTNLKHICTYTHKQNIFPMKTEGKDFWWIDDGSWIWKCGERKENATLYTPNIQIYYIWNALIERLKTAYKNPYNVTGENCKKQMYWKSGKGEIMVGWKTIPRMGRKCRFYKALFHDVSTEKSSRSTM